MRKRKQGAGDAVREYLQQPTRYARLMFIDFMSDFDCKRTRLATERLTIKLIVVVSRCCDDAGNGHVDLQRTIRSKEDLFICQYVDSWKSNCPPEAINCFYAVFIDSFL